MVFWALNGGDWKLHLFKGGSLPLITYLKVELQLIEEESSVWRLGFSLGKWNMVIECHKGTLASVQLLRKLRLWILCRSVF